MPVYYHIIDSSQFETTAKAIEHARVLGANSLLISCAADPESGQEMAKVMQSARDSGSLNTAELPRPMASFSGEVHVWGFSEPIQEIVTMLPPSRYKSIEREDPMENAVDRIVDIYRVTSELSGLCEEHALEEAQAWMNADVTQLYDTAGNPRSLPKSQVVQWLLVAMSRRLLLFLTEPRPESESNDDTQHVIPPKESALIKKLLTVLNDYDGLDNAIGEAYEEIAECLKAELGPKFKLPLDYETWGEKHPRGFQGLKDYVREIMLTYMLGANKGSKKGR